MGKVKKVEITIKQAEQFNRMLSVLHKIGKKYMTPVQIRQDAAKNHHPLSYEEYLEMAYENIQLDARAGANNIQPLKLYQDEPVTKRPE